MRFSERMGIVPVSDVIQTEGMTDALRNSLWNCLDNNIFSQPRFLYNGVNMGYIGAFSRELWANFFKLTVDSRPNHPDIILDQIRQHFFEADWFRVYDLIEYIVRTHSSERLSRDINQILERELSGFRLIDNQFVPVADDTEREAIEEALAPGPFAGVQAHFHQALQHLANREQPDYRNSIKESISAVESMACELTGNPNATLGDALQTLEREGQLHGALRRGFSAIYGYTSDADGIRHAMLEEANLDLADAKYFLVTCAAFVNYLKSKHATAT